MSKSRVSSVNKDRIHNMYVDRLTTTSRASTIDRITPIKPAHNETSTTSDNFLLYTGVFYERFKDLANQYRKFYDQQQALEDILKRFSEAEAHEELPEFDELTQLVHDLVEKYNGAYESLLAFEPKLGISYSPLIVGVLTDHQLALSRIGVTILSDHMLSFNPSILQNNLSFNSDYILFLFDHKNGLIKTLFTIFKNIKVQSIPHATSYNSTSDPSVPAGMLLDQRT
ncbi:hypothetical protein Amet_3065 [Alkaliphilus metalliredigens QYMF]|uniref:Uncharacterized protein n=1 Tax=Alkaliphilus metalliredigens (strain QYMF) TaxID=293826 RepID=A6TSN7_ALKMQ|nr:hypothetical protein [Alkaliphilus metalliredigens]ABR49205.1 hypothetical protein Amet_3065 [Alkaliphilus metalliredigens QYMF]